MNKNDDRPLVERVAELEETVRQLQRMVQNIQPSPTGPKSPPIELPADSSPEEKPEKAVPDLLKSRREFQPENEIAKPVSIPGTVPQQPAESIQPTGTTADAAVPDLQEPLSKPFKLPEKMYRSEYWLNKIGIGLILFAVIFLFKYSIDKGWLTPTIRILFGLALGTTLQVIGNRIYSAKRHFSQVLVGGSIATFYITGYAAFQIFSLISFPVAMVFMVAVTILAFFVSLLRDEAILSIIGTLGGLATPFLLYTGSGNIPGLMIYTCLILAGTSGIYFYRGWRSILWLSTIGGWVIFLISWATISGTVFQSVSGDKWALQSALLFGWLIFWVLPLLREIVRLGNPTRWRQETVGFGDDSYSSRFHKTIDHHLHLFTVSVPFVTFCISFVLWPDLSKTNWGWITMAGVVIYGLVFYWLRRFETLKTLAFTHAILSLSLFTIAISLLLEGDVLFIALATEAAVLHLVSIRSKSNGISIFAHLLSVIVCFWLLDRLQLDRISTLMHKTEGGGVFNAGALADLWAIMLTIFLSIRLKSLHAKRTYLIFAFAFFVAWLCRELEGNILFVIITIEAAVLHMIARMKSDRILTNAGHIFFGLIGFWAGARLLNPQTQQTVILNAHSLVSLLSILIAFGVSKLIQTARESNVYRLLIHIFIMGWFASELISLNNGQGYITIAWGSYAALLLVLGLRYNYSMVRSVALVTLFVVVGKLFLVDLANLEVLWRILLFWGFGGLFLFLSYYFQDLWKAKTTDDNQGADQN